MGVNTELLCGVVGAWTAVKSIAIAEGKGWDLQVCCLLGEYLWL